MFDGDWPRLCTRGAVEEPHDAHLGAAAAGLRLRRPPLHAAQESGSRPRRSSTRAHRQPSRSPGVSRRTPMGRGSPDAAGGCAGRGDVTADQFRGGHIGHRRCPERLGDRRHPDRNDGDGNGGADATGRRARNGVNPASPTFNQGQGATGTSGTVGRANTAGAAIASASYRLRAPKGLDLAAHVGHTVEVRGLLAPDPRAQGGAAASAPGAFRRRTRRCSPSRRSRTVPRPAHDSDAPARSTAEAAQPL